MMFNLFGKKKQNENSGSKVLNARNSSGNFEATRGDNKNMYGWNPVGGSADSDMLEDTKDLRRKSRDLARNSTIGGGAISTKVNNSIGNGLKPQSRVMYSLVGLTKEQAREWQEKATNLFWLWAESKLCDMTKYQNFWELQRLVLRSKDESGDCFVVRRYMERGGILGLTLQVIEADRICNPNGVLDTSRLAAGIEKNENGEPTAYWVSNRSPDDYTISGPQTWVKVDPSVMIHIMERLRPDQSRGIPFLSGVIEQLKQLSKLTEAELSASVLTSKLVLVAKSSNKDVPMFPGQLPGQVDSAAGITVNGSPAPLAPTGSKVAKFSSGTIIEASPDEDLNALTPTRPNAAFAPFFEALVREIGIMLQIPYETLILYYSSSYTSARASQLDSRKTWNYNIDFMAHNFCDIVWGWFLEEAIAKGMLSAPGFFTNPIVRLAYSPVQWVGPAQGSLNPSVEADANYKNMAMNATTLQKVCNENGSDWLENIEQRQMEIEKQWQLPVLPNPSMISSPIAPGGIMNGKPAVANPVIPSTEENEDDLNNGGSK